MGWDLSALYRDEMNLRQLRVRLNALPHDAPLRLAIETAQEQAVQAEREAAVNDALNRYRR